MRKHFTLTSVVIISLVFSSKAQVINKGDKLFGGSFSISFVNLDNNGPGYYNLTNVGLQPTIGWAIKDNIVIGANGSLNYSHSQSALNVSDKSITNSFSFGIGVFLKKYRLLKNKFGLYFDNSLNGNYSMNNEKLTSAVTVNNQSHGWSVGYSFSPGVFYKFSESFFGEANIGGLYASYSSNNTSYSSNNNKSLGIGASFLQYFNLGINYRIPAKKI